MGFSASSWYWIYTCSHTDRPSSPPHYNSFWWHWWDRSSFQVMNTVAGWTHDSSPPWFILPSPQYIMVNRNSTKLPCAVSKMRDFTNLLRMMWGAFSKLRAQFRDCSFIFAHSRKCLHIFKLGSAFCKMRWAICKMRCAICKIRCTICRMRKRGKTRPT